MAIYSFIAEEQATDDNDWTVAEMCRVLEVSRSGFYGWQNRPPCDHQVTDAMLAVEIEAIWECSDRTYGSPRTHRWLRRQGCLEPVGSKMAGYVMRIVVQRVAPMFSCQAVHAAAVGVLPGEESSPARRASWSGAECLPEQHSFFGQALHVPRGYVVTIGLTVPS